MLNLDLPKSHSCTERSSVLFRRSLEEVEATNCRAGPTSSTWFCLTPIALLSPQVGEPPRGLPDLGCLVVVPNPTRKGVLQTCRAKAPSPPAEKISDVTSMSPSGMLRVQKLPHRRPDDNWQPAGSFKRTFSDSALHAKHQEKAMNTHDQKAPSTDTFK